MKLTDRVTKLEAFKGTPFQNMSDADLELRHAALVALHDGEPVDAALLATIQAEAEAGLYGVLQ